MLGRTTFPYESNTNVETTFWHIIAADLKKTIPPYTLSALIHHFGSGGPLTDIEKTHLLNANNKFLLKNRPFPGRDDRCSAQLLHVQERDHAMRAC